LFSAAEASGGGPFASSRMRMRRRKRSNGAVRVWVCSSTAVRHETLGEITMATCSCASCILSCLASVMKRFGGSRHGVARQTNRWRVWVCLFACVTSFCMLVDWYVMHMPVCLCLRTPITTRTAPKSICRDDIIAISHAAQVFHAALLEAHAIARGS
jgi:hypothetical protein